MFLSWTIVLILFSTYSSIFFGFSRGAEDSCKKLEFHCHNGRCVSTLLLCDDRDDCGDYSDEIYCDHVESFDNQNHKNCSRIEYTCHDRLTCIPSPWVCDGVSDCEDGSDEISNCHPLNCTGFPCRSTQKCVPMKWRCDGMHDCKDNSDEIGCEIDIHKRCKSEEGRFLCNDGLCLPPASVCNNKTDCLGAEDEGGRCISATSNCKTKKCGDRCMDTPSGPQCYCTIGYELVEDGVTCNDVNECETMEGICSQGCTNTQGSFVCFCKKGFQLQADKYRCQATEGTTMLLVSYPNSIEMYNIRSHDHVEVLRSTTFVDELAYDGIEKTIYWVEKNAEHSSIKKKKVPTATLR